MSYIAKNWAKVASEIKNFQSHSAADPKGELPEFNVFKKPFFTDSRLEDSARQIGFQTLANLYLDRLNDPLIKADLWPLFGQEMIKFSPQTGGMVYFDGVTEVVDTGDDIKMAVMPFSDPKSNFKIFTGRYAPLMFTRQAYCQRGALGVCLVNLSQKPPPGVIQGRVVLEKNTLKWLNSELVSRKRIPLSDSLAAPKEHARKLSKSEISIYDHNPDFYTMVNLGGIPLRFPRADGPSREGEIYAVRAGDRLLLIDELRVLFGYRERGFLRGFYQSKVDSELLDNLDLSLKDFNTVERFKLTSSRLYDYSHPHLNILSLANPAKKLPDLDRLVMSELGIESTKILKLSDVQVWEQVLSGEIVDSFTITSLMRLWQQEGRLMMSPEAKDQGIIMEFRGYASGEEDWSIPYVPADAGFKIGEIIPDSGTTRIVHPVKKVSLEELPENRYFETKAVSDILKDISMGAYDLPTVSAIFITLIQRGLVTLTV